MLVVALLVPLHFTIFIQCFCIGPRINTKNEFDVGVGPDILDSNILEAWLIWILAMKLLNHFRSIDKIHSRFLGLITHFVTLLMNKILQFLIVDAKIMDFGNFKFFFAINLD